MSKNIYDHACNDLDGKPVSLSEYDGQVTLFVNVASECGFTPQYEELEALHQRFKGNGFSVIAFPCNDFGGQEPGSPEEIAATCRTTWGATFPVMEKMVVVEGDGQSVLYSDLAEATGELPKWNFGKYLIDREGRPAAFFGSSVTPQSAEIVERIEDLLQAGSPGEGS